MIKDVFSMAPPLFHIIRAVFTEKHTIKRFHDQRTFHQQLQYKPQIYIMNINNTVFVPFLIRRRTIIIRAEPHALTHGTAHSSLTLVDIWWG